VGSTVTGANVNTNVVGTVELSDEAIAAIAAMHVAGNDTDANKVTATFTPAESTGFTGTKEITVEVILSSIGLTATLKDDAVIPSVEQNTENMSLDLATDALDIELPEGITVSHVGVVYPDVSTAGENVTVLITGALDGENASDYHVVTFEANKGTVIAVAGGEEPGETEPGTSETEPGTSETEPGSSETNPGSSETNPGTSETPEQSEADGEIVEHAVVVLTADTVVMNRKGVATPSIKVYYNGKALSSKKYDVTLTDNDKVGEATATVELAANAGCTFEDGAMSTSVKFNVVADKTDVSTLTVKNVTVTYGQISENVASMLKSPKMTINGKTQKTGVTYTWNLDTDAEAGYHFVTVTATYGETTAEADIVVYVKPAKITLKTITLDPMTVAYASTLDTTEAASVIKAYLVDNGVGGVELDEDDFTVEVSKLSTSLKKAGKRSISYKITLNEDGNYNFGSKFTKSAKASVKVG
jgi:hypothetical protein